MKRSAILAQRNRLSGGGSTVPRSSPNPSSSSSSATHSPPTLDTDDTDDFLSSHAKESMQPSSLCLSDAKKKFMQAALPPATSSHIPPDHSIDASTAAMPTPASASSSSNPSSSHPKLPPFSPAKRFFQPPGKGSGIVPSSAAHAAAASGTNTANPKERVFAVNFTKRSTKKHKNYDEGILVVCGRKCVLRDSASQVLSNQLASQSTEKLAPGSTLMLGTHEIEIGDPIPHDDFMSGRCFVGAPTPAVSQAKVWNGNKTNNSESSNDTNDVTESSESKPRSRHANLFSKQPLANKPTKAIDPTAMLNDPSILILNKDGVLTRGEKVVLVDAFLTKCLRPHQREAIQFMFDSVIGNKSAGIEGCILADSMGLGKTLSAIGLFWTLLNSSISVQKKSIVSKVIIVCPATLVGNWQKEITQWLGSHRCKPIVLQSTLPLADQQQRIQDFIHGLVNNVVIIGYELLRKHANALKVVQSPLLICDEGHRLKSTTVNQTIKALNTISTKKRIMLTGTPVQNDLGEFFAMCDFVNPGIMGSLSAFSRTFQLPITRSRDASATKYEKELGEARSKELATRTQTFVLRRNNDILLQYLPEKIEQVLFIPLTPFQANIYKALLRGKAVRQFVTRGSEGYGNEALALQAINVCKKLCNHPALAYQTCSECAEPNDSTSAYSFYDENYVPQSAFSDVTQSSKLNVLHHLLLGVRQEGAKVVICSNYTQTLDMLGTYLAKQKFQYLRLDGSTPVNERQPIVDRFNAPYNSSSECFVFLLSSRAGGVGLNLIGSNRLILFDPDWNPAIDQQAMSRIWRDGQRKTVFIYRFLSTATIDEKIYMRQLRKGELSCSVMQGGGSTSASESVMRNFDSKSLKEVFTYPQQTTCETRDVLLRTKKKQAKGTNRDEEDANSEGNASHADDELEVSMGDFHENLLEALDPLLRSLPSHLISAFLNRVSSAEENRRSLEMLAARQEREQQNAENRLSKQGGAESDQGTEQIIEDATYDEEGELELFPAHKSKNESNNNGSAAASSKHNSTDDDEGEAEFGAVEAPADLFTFSTSEEGKTDSTAPMRVDDEEQMGTPSRKRKSMRIIEEDDEEAVASTEGDSDDFPLAQRESQQQRNNSKHVSPSKASTEAEDEELPDWMQAPPSSASSASSISEKLENGTGQKRRSKKHKHTDLDAVAASIVAPEQSLHLGMEVEYHLGTIAEGAKKPSKVIFHE